VAGLPSIARRSSSAVPLSAFGVLEGPCCALDLVTGWAKAPVEMGLISASLERNLYFINCVCRHKYLSGSVFSVLARWGCSHPRIPAAGDDRAEHRGHSGR